MRINGPLRDEYDGDFEIDEQGPTIAANPSKDEAESYTSCEEDDPRFLFNEDKEVETITKPASINDIK